MSIVSEVTRNLSSTLEQLNTTESLFKNMKTLKPVPSGRPRRQILCEVSSSPSSRKDDDYDFTEVLRSLRTELDVKRREEEKLQKEIAEILAETSTVGGEQSRAFGMAVSRLNNSMLVVEADAKQLTASLSTISRLADSISGKVSALDVAKTRVVECLQLSGDMRDLGVCSEGVDEAIRSEDFEQAAQHIHRFLTLDKAVFQLKDSVDKEAGQSVLHSYEVLTSAAARLKEILEKRLDEAVVNNDVSGMQRFVKLFPLLNAHDSGLSRFGKYLGLQILRLGEENVKIMNAGGTDDSRVNVLFADTLFLFFEGVASLLEANQPLIENAYGADKLLDFINMLQNDIDAIVAKILESFGKKRQVESHTRMARKLLRDGKNTVSERPDPRSLDTLLSEICLMNTHSEMYWRFVRRRLGDSPGKKTNEFVMIGDDQDELDEEARKRLEVERLRRREQREKKLDQLLNRSLVGTKMQELLGHYILLEQYYMEESVRKAIDMDLREEGKLSSVVDDVMFLVRKCVKRAMSSGSIDCVCATLNNGCALLETSYLQYLEAAISVGYPAAGFAAEAFQTAQTAYNVIQHGKTVTEAGPDAQRESFITATNNVRGTADFVGQLKVSLHNEWMKKERPAVDSGKLEHALAQLDDVSKRMIRVAGQAVESLCTTAFRPKLKTSCEAYIDVPHCLSDNQLAEIEAVDPFIEQFNANLDKQIADFQPVLLEEVYKALLLVVCGEVVRQMERVVFKCSFNRLGGLQLDKEFRQLSAYLSGVASYAAREKTKRLDDIASLLNVESVDEARDLWEAGRGAVLGFSLSANEARKVLLLRTDLPANLVQQLQL